MRNFYFAALLLIVFSCSSDDQSQTADVKWSKEKSMALNKTIAKEEKLKIKLFLVQHPTWKMIETGSGLQYYIYENGKGEIAKAGSVVDAEYSVSELNGTVCYKTEEDEVVEIVVDHSQVETGVQEGLKKMREGDKEKMIIPSHLAHGLTGDMNKIKPLTPIVVDLHLIEIFK